MTGTLQRAPWNVREGFNDAKLTRDDDVAASSEGATGQSGSQKRETTASCYRAQRTSLSHQTPIWMLIDQGEQYASKKGIAIYDVKHCNGQWL